jgi:hypothetical protein
MGSVKSACAKSIYVFRPAGRLEKTLGRLLNIYILHSCLVSVQSTCAKLNYELFGRPAVNWKHNEMYVGPASQKNARAS